MYNTDTFTLGETEKTSERAFGGGFVMEDVYYCSYCGKKATKEDIGSTHNHRWEEEIVHFCDCDNARYEIQIKEKISQLESELYKEKRKLKEMETKTNNQVTNKMKFDNEVKKLKEKYNIVNDQ